MAKKKQTSSSSGYFNHDILTYVPLDHLYRVFDRHRDDIKAWAFAFHDHDVFTEKDELENPLHVAGTLKEKHFHVILRLYRRVRCRTVCDWFYYLDGADLPVTTRSIPCDSVAKRFEYLLHSRDSGKFQYPLKNRICTDPSLFENVYEDTTDSLTECYLDLMSGTKTDTLIRRYGRDFIIHYQKLFDLAARVRAEGSFRSEADFRAAQFTEVDHNPF